MISSAEYEKGSGVQYLKTLVLGVAMLAVIGFAAAMVGVLHIVEVRKERDAAYLAGITEGAKQQALKREGWKECLLK